MILDYVKGGHLSDSHTEIMWKFPRSIEEMSIYTTAVIKYLVKHTWHFIFYKKIPIRKHPSNRKEINFPESM